MPLKAQRLAANRIYFVAFGNWCRMRTTIDSREGVTSRSKHHENRYSTEYLLSTTTPGPRDIGIDFTKGALVLFMVLYHWLNYFISSNGQYYNYLRFLTPSFIFVTGFMISQIHLRRYGSTGLTLPRRLTIRGLKLLGVFVGLNVIIGAALAGRLFWRSPAVTLFSAFISGNTSTTVGEKIVSFNILVPIAYLLILSAALVVLARRVQYIFHWTLIVCVGVIVFLSSHGVSYTYLDVLMPGLLGVVTGFATREQIAAFLSRPYILIAAYCLFVVIITLHKVTLPLQIASVILTTALLHIASTAKAVPNSVRCITILLGRYSLVGYISQIAILRGLRGISLFSQRGSGALIASLALGFLVTVMTAELTDLARRRSRLANGLYELVFA
jgi:hypothetical protein